MGSFDQRNTAPCNRSFDAIAQTARQIPAMDAQMERGV
jgi:hypothetical protein